MEKCNFCGIPTSFKSAGGGQYDGKYICPKCQSENFNINFNTGCADDNDCSIKIKKIIKHTNSCFNY